VFGAFLALGSVGDVDLQERLALDVARDRLVRVKARARPWRTILALVLALIAASVSTEARHVADLVAEGHNGGWLGTLGHSGNLGLSYGTAVAFLLFAGVATIGLGNKVGDMLRPSVGSSHAAVVRFAVLLIAGLATIVITMQLFAIPVTQLVVGGALTGVLVGIAAQQSLANIFAGIVLLLARPFRVGDTVGIRSGALSGLIEGTVSEVSVTYVRLETPNGPVHVPNSQVLAAAVGPAGAVPPPTSAPSPGPGAPPPGPGSAPPATAGAAPPGPGPWPADAAALPGAQAAEPGKAAEPGREATGPPQDSQGAPAPGTQGTPPAQAPGAAPDAGPGGSGQRDAGPPGS
jgi:mechanosensitive ion channel-like protein